MVTLLASIAGFLTSMIPEIVKFFKDKNDKKHELDIMTIQLQLSKMKIGENLNDIKAQYDLSELSSLYGTFKSGINWIDALNASVRPVMAYCFFGLYAFLKYVQYLSISKLINASGVIVDMLWTVDDQAIFAGIISFYFGQRTFNKNSRIRS
jgi:hypothetical protein